MAVVHFTPAQRPWVGGAESIVVDARRVSELIRKLEETYPELAGKLEGAAVRDSARERVAAFTEDPV